MVAETGGVIKTLIIFQRKNNNVKWLDIKMSFIKDSLILNFINSLTIINIFLKLINVLIGCPQVLSRAIKKKNMFRTDGAISDWIFLKLNFIIFN